jgi:hypothetical protein
MPLVLRHGHLSFHGVSLLQVDSTPQVVFSLLTSHGIGIHDHVLALWGMPLGELWDLESLATECENHKRWSFFLTSAPLNTPGGIASPPNALAVF